MSYRKRRQRLKLHDSETGMAQQRRRYEQHLRRRRKKARQQAGHEVSP